MSVLLPAPLGPTSPMIPGAILIVRESNAVTPGYRFVSLVAVRSAVPSGGPSNFTPLHLILPERCEPMSSHLSNVSPGLSYASPRNSPAEAGRTRELVEKHGFRKF